MSSQFQTDLINTLIGFIPPLLVGGVFWIIMRSILKADSVERREYAKIEAEERAKAAMSDPAPVAGKTKASAKE
jgi:hypothetical protein